MAVKITITNAGYTIGSTLDLYSNESGSWTFLETVQKIDLLNGYIFNPPIGATAYQIRDIGECGTVLELSCGTPPPTTSSTSSTTSSTTTEVPQETLYWKFYRMCFDDWCYMTDDVKNTLELSLCLFQTGDRFYGAVEGDSSYLYLFTNQFVYFSVPPDCILSGITRTTDDCNGPTGQPLPECILTSTSTSTSSSTSTSTTSTTTTEIPITTTTTSTTEEITTTTTSTTVV